MAGENLRVCSKEPAAQLVCFPRQVCNARWKYLHVEFIEDILSLLHVVKADDLLIHSMIYIVCVCVCVCVCLALRSVCLFLEKGVSLSV